MEMRQYYWAALLLAIIVVAVIIVIIFIFINICISKRASWYSTKIKPNHYTETNVKKQEKEVYHKAVTDEKPPLPSRDQFLSKESEAQSYEDVSNLPDYVFVEGSTPPPTPKSTFSPNHTIAETKSQDSEDYDDVEVPADCDSEDYDDIG